MKPKCEGRTSGVRCQRAALFVISRAGGGSTLACAYHLRPSIVTLLDGPGVIDAVMVGRPA